MERPKYQLIILLLMLAFTSAGEFSDDLKMNSVIYYTDRYFAADIKGRQSISNALSQPFKEQIYQAYITGNMKAWESVIHRMESQHKEETDFLLELINYQYGYVAWCLGNNNKSKAKKYLSFMESNLSILKTQTGKTAAYHAYSAAAYGFRIGLSNWRAPLLGPKSMMHAEKSIQADSLSFQANMELGNIWNHMPAVFGGSGEKALHFYYRALKIMEKKPEKVKNNNWMYLNLLTLMGQVHKKEGQPEQAQKYFEQALKIEPEFVWVKEELLPSLIE